METMANDGPVTITGSPMSVGVRSGWTSWWRAPPRSVVVDGFIHAQEFLNLCARFAIVPYAGNG